MLPNTKAQHVPMSVYLGLFTFLLSCELNEDVICMSVILCFCSRFEWCHLCVCVRDESVEEGELGFVSTWYSWTETDGCCHMLKHVFPIWSVLSQGCLTSFPTPTSPFWLDCIERMCCSYSVCTFSNFSKWKCPSSNIAESRMQHFFQWFCAYFSSQQLHHLFSVNHETTNILQDCQVIKT